MVVRVVLLALLGVPVFLMAFTVAQGMVGIDFDARWPPTSGREALAYMLALAIAAIVVWLVGRLMYSHDHNRPA